MSDLAVFQFQELAVVRKQGTFVLERGASAADGIGSVLVRGPRGQAQDVRRRPLVAAAPHISGPDPS